MRPSIHLLSFKRTTVGKGSIVGMIVTGFVYDINPNCLYLVDKLIPSVVFLIV